MIYSVEMRYVKMEKQEFEYANPNPASLIQSLRAFGYDIATAIADLIDNSITAQAKRVRIQFDWNNGQPVIFIADDGYGMNESELFEAMKTGSKNPLDDRSIDDLGRFGLGMKTASFSQCKKLTVASKVKDKNICVRCWDLDIVTQKNEWILLKKSSKDADKLIKQHFKNNSSGTIVIWEKLDRIVPGALSEDEEYQKAFLTYANSVKEHISVVYSGFMQGKNKILFELNDREIPMWDPFMNNNVFTTRLPTESLYVNGHEVIISTYILPHQSKLTPQEFAENAGVHGWNAQQGFYIYRNNRLIVEADWLLDGMEKLEQYRLARIRIDIGNETDDDWNLDVRKSTASPPVSIQKELRRIAVAAQRESSKIYRHRGKKLARKGKKEQFYVWHQNTRHGKLGYSINREHPIVRTLLESDRNKEIKQLLDLIEETIPIPMIISDYSEKSDEMLTPFEGKNKESFDPMIQQLLDLYLSKGYSEEEAIRNIASTEPFIYAPEKISVFCERKGIQIE